VFVSGTSGRCGGEAEIVERVVCSAQSPNSGRTLT
jgi:hypothetical protein